MGKVKISEVKSVLSAAKKARSQNSKLLMPRRVGLSTGAASERAKLLTSFFKKAGLDVSKLAKIQDKRLQIDIKPSPNLAMIWTERYRSAARMIAPNINF